MVFLVLTRAGAAAAKRHFSAEPKPPPVNLEIPPEYEGSEPDQCYINYMSINLGEMKRCECGYWYKAVQGDPDVF
uniref:Uncharacterized protein n=1 Tax=Romanomermis culicivorax TaxID=13658 RepID=A0A915L502_ROMCU